MSNKLPSVTSDIPRDLRTFIDRVRELISGNSTDRLVSAKDLIDGGVVNIINNTIVTTATTTDKKIGLPPAPANLSATGAVNDVFLEWDNPTYYGHQYTEVFSGATNAIGDAVLLGFTPGVVYVDTIGPQQQRYYWVRFVNLNGDKGPFNAVAGTLGTTTVEVAHMLDVLTGAITETELYSELGDRIDLVDTTNGGLISKYTVKIDNNGYVSGFGLASTANNATPYSDFIIRADRFSISSPSGPGITPVTPFIVVTTPTVIDGANVPVGVYIDGGYIKGGSIQGSAIVGGTITNSKLINVSANKITGAALEATSYIESAAYIAGSQGWKIHANGTAEFAAASIRGQLTASQIDTRGLTIKDSSGTVIFSAGVSLDYSRINANPGWLNSALEPSIATANSNATTALNSVAGKLNKAGDTITGRVTFSVADGMFAGSDTSNGVYFGSSGLIGRKAGANTFYVDTAGNAVFGGTLSAATGSFAGSMAVGTNPAISSGPNMTGSGANIYSDGKFVLGNSTTNLAFDGSTLKLNGNIVNTNSIPLGAISTTVSATGAINFTFTSSTSASVTTASTTFPAGTVINCFFTAVKVAAGSGDINLLLNLRLSDNTLVDTFLGQSGLEAVQTMGPSGDKVTATFTGTYVIPFDGSFKVEAYISNGYGNSWTCKHADLIVLASKR